MRCPYCDEPNEDGAALCTACGAPLTPYAATVPVDADPERTAAKIAAMNERPPVTLVVTIADIAAAIVAVVITLRSIAATPQLSADATNYLGRAFGGLRAALTAGVLLPTAAALALLAWGAYTEKPWAWTVHAVVFAFIALVSVVTLRVNATLSLLELAIVGVVAWQWFQPNVRRWYGRE